MNTDYSQKTREIYHQQHMKVVGDKKAMDRFIGMFDTGYFGLGKNYFEGKTVLDAGCGDTAKLLIALSRFGATEIFGLDLGTEFISGAQGSLEKHDVSLDKITLLSGNILELPFEDNYFDFVSCHGVLVHLNNTDEVKKAFCELARVTKHGGYLYTVYGIVGGLLEESVYPAVRKYYQNNAEFKKFIDDIDPANFNRIFDIIQDGMEKYANEKKDLLFLKSLVDIDLCVTIQNIIQAPVRLKIDEKLILSNYSKHNFENIHRLRRFVKRKNIRKFFAPLHYEVEDEFSKLIYGSGNLEFIGRKI